MQQITYIFSLLKWRKPAHLACSLLFSLLVMLQALIADFSVRAEVPADKTVDYAQYQIDMDRQLRRNWFPPKSYTAKCTLLRWTISKNGQISNIHITQSSGSAAVDSAAFQAVQLSNPLFDLPQGAPESIEVEFKFEYKAANTSTKNPSVSKSNGTAGNSALTAPSANSAQFTEKPSDKVTEAEQGTKSKDARLRHAAEQHERAFAILASLESKTNKDALEQAVSYARSATSLDPKDAAHWFLAGLLYQELDTFDNRALPMAEKMLTQTLEIDPEYAPAWLELGLMMAAQDRGMESIAALEQALETNPGSAAFSAVGPLCAMYAANDEGLRGLDFFVEQYEANPEISAFGVGSSLMLNFLGDRTAALLQARDLLLIEEAGTAERAYVANLVSQWEREP